MNKVFEKLIDCGGVIVLNQDNFEDIASEIRRYNGPELCYPKRKDIGNVKIGNLTFIFVNSPKESINKLLKSL